MRLLRRYGRELAFVVLVLGIEIAEAQAMIRLGEEYWYVPSLAVLLTGACATGFWLWTPSQQREPWAGLCLNDSIGKHVGLGLLMAVIYYGVSFVVPWCLGIITVELHPQGLLSAQVQPLGSLRGGLAIVLIWFVFGAVNALRGEELAFRGYLFGSIERKSGVWTAVAWNVVVFVAWHFPSWILLERRLEKPFAFMLDAVWLGLGTVALCLMFAGTRSLYAVSLYHVIVHLKSCAFCRMDRLTSENASGIFCVYWANNAVLADVFNGAAMVGLIAFGLFVWRRYRAVKDPFETGFCSRSRGVPRGSAPSAVTLPSANVV